MVTVHRARRVDFSGILLGACVQTGHSIFRGGGGHVSKQVTLYPEWGGGGGQMGVSDTGDQVMC